MNFSEHLRVLRAQRLASTGKEIQDIIEFFLAEVAVRVSSPHEAKRFGTVPSMDATHADEVLRQNVQRCAGQPYWIKLP